VNGVLLLDKPIGPTSHDLVMFARRLLHEKKIGHAGTLDPFATGLLVLLVGQATKISSYLLDQDKVYEATVQWGRATDSMDHTGRDVETDDSPLPDRTAIAAALAKFVGAQQQTPPMYSAKKVDGTPLYQLARQGKEVDRPAKQVHIAALDLLAVDETAKTFSLRVHCSKGTYVRTLADSLARELGGKGCLASLRRLRSGLFHVEQALTPEQWRELPPEEVASRLLSLDDALAAFKTVTLSAPAGESLGRHGTPPRAADVLAADDYQSGETLRLQSPDGELVALARARLAAAQVRGPDDGEWPFVLLRVFSSS